MPGILITGIAGGLSRKVAQKLVASGHEVAGVDYRHAAALDGVTMYKASYNKTAIEDVFRRQQPDAVLHLGRIGNLAEDAEWRFEMNVVGTQKIMHLCLQYKVKSLSVLSTFHIYGANPRNHIPISEEDVVRSGPEFPEIADAIQLDNMATTWVHQYRDVRVVVLRPTNVVGPSIQNTMSRLLRLSRVPSFPGFNPMVQFIHEDDLTDAVIAAQAGSGRGVFNVAGGAAVPWRTALELAGARTFPIPSTLMKLYLRVFSEIPAYLVNFFKYPCVISDQAFRKAFDWESKMCTRQTLWETVKGVGPAAQADNRGEVSATG